MRATARSPRRTPQQDGECRREPSSYLSFSVIGLHRRLTPGRAHSTRQRNSSKRAAAQQKQRLQAHAQQQRQAAHRQKVREQSQQRMIKAQREQLERDDAERPEVGREAIRLQRDDFWCHEAAFKKPEVQLQ